jgi:hypothetical protein
MNDIRVSDEEFEYLLSTISVRARAKSIFEKSLAGGTHFEVKLEKLPSCAKFVQDLILENYPDLNVPFHSRWEHFNVGGVDRVSFLKKRLASLDKVERASALADLAIVSVYVDAGAGADWKYRALDGKDYTRSEGLAVASLEMFENGLFSSDKSHPYRVDAMALKNLSLEALRKGFQVSDSNPMTGMEGRALLLRRMGELLESQKSYFEYQGLCRPAHILRWFEKQERVDAQTLLRGLLLGFAEMWPARLRVNGVNFGDLWHYPSSSSLSFANLVPFHKLSQWLAYSLIAPLSEMGVNIQGVEELTGLPEYRNGGLLLDMDVLKVRQSSELQKLHKVNSDFLIEWRALTIHLLDEIAKVIRTNLSKTESELPLGKILQGGTWLAGRKTAARLRNGLPPFQIESDGTVF